VTALPSDHRLPTTLRRQRRTPSATFVFSLGGTAVTIAGMLAMLITFVWQAWPVFRHSGWSYVTGPKWFYRQEIFGALPMIYGTFAVAAIALIIAWPIGVGAAIFSAEFLPNRLRMPFKVTVELLAGVPSVVYGLLGILFQREFVYTTFESFDILTGDTLLTAGLLLAVMILPTIMTLTDDALRSVPAPQRTAARGVGLSRVQAIWAIALPQAKRGMIAAALLALGRAIGETIAVFLVVGRQDNNSPSSLFSSDLFQKLLEPGQTLTSKIGGAETNIAYGDPLHFAAMVGLGLLLMVVVVGVTLIGALLETNGGAHD
jgi:phosphate transport system permease protein